MSRETRGERSQGLGDQRALPAALRGCGVQDATVPGQSASGEAEDVEIKGQLSEAAAEAPGTKADSGWKPRTSPIKLRPAVVWGSAGSWWREVALAQTPGSPSGEEGMTTTRGEARMFPTLLRHLG